MTKTELLALADALDTVTTTRGTQGADALADAAAALREYAGTMDAEPVAWMCPANCGCTWRNNHDGTMSLFGKNSKSCDVCEKLPLDELKPVHASPQAQTQREHITDGSPCWCSPDLDYVDPETGAKIWIHKHIQ
jgi:hypothetical protein